MMHPAAYKGRALASGIAETAGHEIAALLVSGTGTEPVILQRTDTGWMQRNVVIAEEECIKASCELAMVRNSTT